MSEVSPRPWMAWALGSAAFLSALLVPMKSGFLLVALGAGGLALATYAWMVHQASESGEAIPGAFHAVLLLAGLGLGLPGLLKPPPEPPRSPQAPPVGTSPAQDPRIQLRPEENPMVGQAKAQSQLMRTANLIRELNIRFAEKAASEGAPKGDWVEGLIDAVIQEMGTYPNPFDGSPTTAIRAEQPTRPGEIALWPGVRAASQFRPEAKTVELRMLGVNRGAPEVVARTLELME